MGRVAVPYNLQRIRRVGATAKSLQKAVSRAPIGKKGALFPSSFFSPLDIKDGRDGWKSH